MASSCWPVDGQTRAPAVTLPAGYLGLTPRQHLTLRLLLEGGSEADIAARMGISGSTLHKYVAGLFRIFEVHSRAGLQAMFTGCGRLSTEREDTVDPRYHRAPREGLPMTAPWRAAYWQRG